MRQLYKAALEDGSVWVEEVPYRPEIGISQRTMRMLFYNPARISEIDAKGLAAVESTTSRKRVHVERQSPIQRDWIVRGPYDQKATEAVLEAAIEAGAVEIRRRISPCVEFNKFFAYDPEKVSYPDAEWLLLAEYQRTREVALLEYIRPSERITEPQSSTENQACLPERYI
jgi:hypothetical protein